VFIFASNFLRFAFYFECASFSFFVGKLTYSTFYSPFVVSCVCVYDFATMTCVCKSGSSQFYCILKSTNNCLHQMKKK